MNLFVVRHSDIKIGFGEKLRKASTTTIDLGQKTKETDTIKSLLTGEEYELIT